MTPPKPIDTPFVSVPGLLTSQCVVNERGSYLEVTVHGNPTDPRTDDIAGDVMTNGEVNASWGLHLIDVHLAMGNLIDIVRQQARRIWRRRVSRTPRSSGRTMIAQEFYAWFERGFASGVGAAHLTRNRGKALKWTHQAADGNTLAVGFR